MHPVSMDPLYQQTCQTPMLCASSPDGRQTTGTISKKIGKAQEQSKPGDWNGAVQHIGRRITKWLWGRGEPLFHLKEYPNQYCTIANSHQLLYLPSWCAEIHSVWSRYRNKQPTLSAFEPVVSSLQTCGTRHDTQICS